MTDTEFEMTVEFGVDGTKQKFNSLGELKDFLQSESENWQWINDADNSTFQHLRGQIPARINNIIRTINQYEQDNNPSRYDAIEPSVRQVYLTSKMPTSRSKLGQFILDYSEEDKDLAAAILSAQLEFPIQNPNQWSAVKGRTLLVLFEEPFLDRDLEAVQKSLAKLSSQHSVELEQLKTEQKRLVGEAEKQIEDNKAASEEDLKNRSEEWAMLAEKIALSIKEVKDVKRQFQEFMGLKAPVEYWSKKAEEHKQRSKANLERLSTFAIAGGGGLIVVLATMVIIAWNLSASNPPLPVYLTLVTVSVAVTTGVIWAARVFVRNYLSEQHLYIDAEERATMIQTHLALIEGGNNDPEERKILLQSIFRPTADGMVRDDAAPTFPGANLLNNSGG